jgi:hypothetical protein
LQGKSKEKPRVLHRFALSTSLGFTNAQTANNQDFSGGHFPVHSSSPGEMQGKPLGFCNDCTVTKHGHFLGNYKDIQLRFNSINTTNNNYKSKKK